MGVCLCQLAKESRILWPPQQTARLKGFNIDFLVKVTVEIFGQKAAISVNYHWHVCTFEKEERKERMLNLVKPKENNKRMGEIHKETTKTAEVKVGCWFYEGTIDVCFSVGSMFEAGYVVVCGFPKAKQPGPPSSHRHKVTHNYSEGREARVFSVLVEKKEGRVNEGNPSCRGGPQLGPEFYCSPSWNSLSLSQAHMNTLNTWGEALSIDSCWGGVWILQNPLPVIDYSSVTCQCASG